LSPVRHGGIAVNAMETASVSVRATPAKDDLIVELSIRNQGQTPIYVEKYNACADGVIEHDVFTVLTETEARVDYVGPMVKRGRAQGHDYIKILPKGAFSTSVRLGTAYRLLKGTHTYRIGYSAVVTYPDKDEIWTLASAKVETATVTR
jgi:hypothetical protein